MFDHTSKSITVFLHIQIDKTHLHVNDIMLC